MFFTKGQSNHQEPFHAVYTIYFKCRQTEHSGSRECVHVRHPNTTIIDKKGVLIAYCPHTH